MKQQLKKLRALIKESEHLQAEYDDMICFPSEEVVDSVNDYKTGYPHVVMISGMGDPRFALLREKLATKNREIQLEIAALENYLDSVEDPEMRDILRLQYVNGLTIEQIAEELNYSTITIKRRLKSFWEKENHDTE